MDELDVRADPYRIDLRSALWRDVRGHGGSARVARIAPSKKKIERLAAVIGRLVGQPGFALRLGQRLQHAAESAFGAYVLHATAIEARSVLGVSPPDKLGVEHLVVVAFQRVAEGA